MTEHEFDFTVAPIACPRCAHVMVWKNEHPDITELCEEFGEEEIYRQTPPQLKAQQECPQCGFFATIDALVNIFGRGLRDASWPQ